MEFIYACSKGYIKKINFVIALIKPKKRMVEDKNYVPKQEKKPPYILILLIIILVGGLGIISSQYLRLKNSSEEREQFLEEEKADLTNQLNDMYTQYDSLKTENDTINLKLEAEQAKIQRLLAINASNVQKIKLYKKELGTLRNIMRSYIIQIDSLNRRNQELVAENKEVRTQLYQIESSKKQLEEQNVELSSKVETASILQAKNIIATPLNKRSNENFSTNKVVKIKTCFTVRENAIVPAGTKTLYIRIVRPDEVVLANSPDNLFEYNDEMIVYSAKRDLEYENQDIDICIFWDRDIPESGITKLSEDLIGGTYSVDIFHNGNIIGTTTFTLKEGGGLFN